MFINHIGLYVKDLEIMKGFYCKYFDGVASARYTNTKKGFSSYFITFNDGARLELMTRQGVNSYHTGDHLGFAHIAFSLGSRDRVDALTKTLKADGFIVSSDPRVTGDGYYESVIRDPEGNGIELTV